MKGIYPSLFGPLLGLGLRVRAGRLLHELTNANAIAQTTLRRILELNGNTSWGRRWDFNRPQALAAFRDMPLTTYLDYIPYIERIAAGEPYVLTGEPVTYLAVTSGTTGPQKLIPITERLIRVHLRSTVMAMGLAMRAGALGPIRGRTLMLMTELPGGVTTGGIPKGAATSSALQKREALFSAIWTSPITVIRTQEQAANRYLHLLFALGEEHLWAIVSFFPSTLLFLLRDLHARAPELLRDLADGTISRQIDLPASAREELERRLTPNPRRARTLTALFDQGRFTARDLWPDARAVLTAASGPFSFYVDQLRPYLGDMTVFSAIYAASEASMGIGLAPSQPGYALAPVNVFMEFLPIESAERANMRPLALDEVELGQQYEVVVTTYAGLTRYRLGDVVQIVGRYGQAPIFQFVERKGQVLSIVGEKTSEARIVRAFTAACLDVGAAVLDYIVTPDVRTLPPRYLLLVEELQTAGSNGAAPPLDTKRLVDAFERRLRHESPDYDDCRRIDELGPLAVHALKPGAFEQFRAMRVAAGAGPTQVKVPHVVRNPWLAASYFPDEPPTAIAPNDRFTPTDQQ